MELYGVLSQHQFFILWEKYTGEPLDMLDFLKMLRKRSLVRGLCNPFYTDNKLCLSNANLDYPHDLYEAVQKRKDLDYHLYSLDTLLLSSEDYLSIIDERSLLPLVEILDQMNEDDEILTTMQLTGLWVMFQNGAPHGELIKFLANQLNFDTLENINQLVTAVTNFTNALPNWLLKGHTPNALHSKNPINLKDPLLRKQVNDPFSKKFPNEPSVMDSFLNKTDHPDNVVPFTPRPTAGRNDPCPCGSGKKYKKCCGAN